jgi:hypothetical protein
MKQIFSIRMVAQRGRNLLKHVNPLVRLGRDFPYVLEFAPTGDTPQKYWESSALRIESDGRG